MTRSDDLSTAANACRELADEITVRSHSDENIERGDHLYALATRLESLRAAEIYFDCSTAHITYRDLCMLARSAEPPRDPVDPQPTRYPRVIDHRYGAWVHVSDTDELDANLGPNIARVLRVARERGCRWVNFDGDGTDHADLPRFD